jgi:hypothetical protein
MHLQMHPALATNKSGDSSTSGWNSSVDSDEQAPAAIMRSSFGIRYGPLPPADGASTSRTLKEVSFQ